MNEVLELKNISLSNKVKCLCTNKNSFELIESIVEDIKSEGTRCYKRNEYYYYETKNNTYKFKDNVLINMFKKKPISNEEIVKSLKEEDIIIMDYIVDMFVGIKKDKILEVVKLYIDSCSISKRTLEEIYISNKLSEVILVFDYYNNSLEKILNNQFQEIKHPLMISNDKIVISYEHDIEPKKILTKEDICNRLSYFDSYVYDVDKCKNDILNNYVSYKVIDKSRNAISIYTTRYIYSVIDYNVVGVRGEDGLPIPTNSIKRYNNSPLNVEAFKGELDLNYDYITNVTTKSFYNSYLKAMTYINRLGLSIRVIIKFILDTNLLELYKFITSDIFYYGVVKYDNYLNNEMIIVTNRFCYIIKNSVIINIKTIQYEEIDECSIEFKTFRRGVIKKEKIVDLDIKDTVRNYITKDHIDGLRINKHAKKRFQERISKKNSLEDQEYKIKRDIYKHGKVMLGTYYLNTKLIKGLKNVYVLSNNEIVSIWRCNDVIENINNRYYKQVEVFDKEVEGFFPE